MIEQALIWLIRFLWKQVGSVLIFGIFIVVFMYHIWYLIGTSTLKKKECMLYGIHIGIYLDILYWILSCAMHVTISWHCRHAWFMWKVIWMAVIFQFGRRFLLVFLFLIFLYPLSCFTPLQINIKLYGLYLLDIIIISRVKYLILF